MPILGQLCDSTEFPDLVIAQAKRKLRLLHRTKLLAVYFNRDRVHRRATASFAVYLRVDCFGIVVVVKSRTRQEMVRVATCPVVALVPKLRHLGVAIPKEIREPMSRVRSEPNLSVSGLRVE